MASSDVKLTLHWLDGSRAQATMFLLEQLELPYEIKIYKRNELRLAPPELEKVHPLGHSPVLTIEHPGATEPIVLAEGPFIAQYLVEHFDKEKKFAPKRWKDGQEGQIGGETDTWMRYQYLLYYSEGSLQPMLLVWGLMVALKSPAVPFFVRPIMKFVADKIINQITIPNLRKHAGMLEQFLETSGGNYLCGDHLTAPDFVLSFPLLGGKDTWKTATKWEKGTFEATFPKLTAYVERISQEPAWNKTVTKIKEVTGDHYILPRAF